MRKDTLTIFIDGQYQKITEADLKKFSPGFLNGLGVFETVLCEAGAVYFLKEHYSRFVYGCDRYILPRPPALADIKKILAELGKVNRLQNARVRMAAWRKGHGTHFVAVMIPREAFPQKVYQQGFAACFYPQCLDRSPELAKIKSLDYRFFLKAYEYALEQDCHEALLLNSSGHVVEGSRSNIFVVRKNKLLTPGLSSGCLAGVSRAAVLAAAKAAGVKTLSQELTVQDLHRCEEAFLTNSLVEIMPLTSLSGHNIGSGRPGPVTSRLMKGYKKLSRSHRDFLL